MPGFTVENIQSHPYVETSGLFIEAIVRPRYVLPRVVALMAGIVDECLTDPMDIIVGQDVSGRVPTLVAHRILKQAQADRHIGVRPKIFFMTGGRESLGDDSEAGKIKLASNLKEHAGKITRAMTVNKAVIVTDSSFSGRSFEYLSNAFQGNGVQRVERRSIGNDFYLNTPFKCDGRVAAGVEKYSPEPISRRHPDFDAARVAQLRHFLDDYAEAIYGAIFNEGG